jgi:hypothetical protein
LRADDDFVDHLLLVEQRLSIVEEHIQRRSARRLLFIVNKTATGRQIVANRQWV